MPDPQSMFDSSRAELVLIAAIQILTIVGGVVTGIIALRRQSKTSNQKIEEYRTASEIRMREMQTEDRKRAQEHEQRLEEARQKADTERTVALERMATTRDDMLLRLMSINEKFTASVDAFRGSVDASNKITADSTTALRDHTRAIGAIQDNIIANLKAASDERMGAVRELIQHDQEHAKALDTQLSLSRDMPAVVMDKIAPHIQALSAGIQSTIDSLNAMRSKVDALHTITERHASATSGIALIVDQINEAVKKIDDSTSRIDKTASALMTAIVDLKEVNDHAAQATSIGSSLPLDRGLHPADGGKPNLRPDGGGDGLDIKEHSPSDLRPADR